jgi:hypothetical protein
MVDDEQRNTVMALMIAMCDLSGGKGAIAKGERCRPDLQNRVRRTTPTALRPSWAQGAVTCNRDRVKGRP